MISLDTMFQDLRYGFRMLLRQRGFAAVAILALGIGIAVNTAVFTAYKAMIARPLDARNPGEMVNLGLIRHSGVTDPKFSYADFEAYRDEIHSFAGVIAFRMEQLRLTGAGGVISQRRSTADSIMGRLGAIPSGAANTEFANVEAVSDNYFRVLGVGTIRGRTFESLTPDELVHSPSVLISENYWQRRFALDPAILGKTVQLNGVSVQIIGITPHDFVGTGIAAPDYWLPLSLEPLVHADSKWLQDRTNQCCRLFARLAPGANIQQAESELTIVANHLRTLNDPHSELFKPVTALVWPGCPFPLPLNDYHGLMLTVMLVMLAAAMLLMVACANVGSLQLARARSREHEMLTRLSLGASRIRIVRQLLTESMLLGLIAGCVGLGLAWAFLRTAIAVHAQLVPAEFSSLVFNVNPDPAIFAYVFATSLTAGILFGVAPAIETSRFAIASGDRSGTASSRTRRIQNLLVMAQVGLSLALMIAATMLIRSANHSLHMETGYDSKHVIDIDLQFPESSRLTSDRKLDQVRQLRSELGDLPDVAAVTSAHAPGDLGFRTAASGQNGKSSLLYYTYVQPNYFATLGIPILFGNGWPSQAAASRSVLLSESAAQRIWPGQNPVGRTLRLGQTDERSHAANELAPDSAEWQVIGVVRDTRGAEFDGSDSAQVYLPLSDAQLANRPILIRTHSDPAAMLKQIDSVVATIDPDLTANTSTLNEMLRRSAPFMTATVAAIIASSVGFLGLLLALMGIYGTVNYIVVLRTREVGIRMAVGAQKRDVLWLILRESTKPVVTGLLVGMLFGTGCTYLLRKVLYGLKTVDAISFLGMAMLFLFIALLAAYPPSRRATRIDPMDALRYE